MILYFLFIAPAVLLGMWAQWRVHATYAAASHQPAALTGAAAARRLLDSAGLQEVQIEPIRGQLTDHYDPRTRVLRLSEGVYDQRNLAAVGKPMSEPELHHILRCGSPYAALAGGPSQL